MSHVFVHSMCEILWLKERNILGKNVERRCQRFSRFPRFSQNMYSTSSQSSECGTSIYVKNNLHTFERNDLKIQHNKFEAVWVEICGSI